MKIHRKRAEAADLAQYWLATLDETVPFYDQDFVNGLHDYMEVPRYNIVERSHPDYELPVRSWHSRIASSILLSRSKYQDTETLKENVADIFFQTYLRRLNKLQRLIIYLVP